MKWYRFVSVPKRPIPLSIRSASVFCFQQIGSVVFPLFNFLHCLVYVSSLYFLSLSHNYVWMGLGFAVLRPINFWRLRLLRTPPTACSFGFQMSRSMTKPIKWHVRPVKTQISLSIRPVWSKSLPFAWIYLGSLAIHSAHSEDPDQTGHWADPPSLIWVFAGCSEHFVCFVMLRHIYIEIPITWSNSWFGAVGADGDAKSLSVPGCV